jgi:hypothetical protein
MNRCATCRWWSTATMMKLRPGWRMCVWHNGTKGAKTQTLDCGRAILRTHETFGCPSWEEDRREHDGPNEPNKPPTGDD